MLSKVDSSSMLTRNQLFFPCLCICSASIIKLKITIHYLFSSNGSLHKWHLLDWCCLQWLVLCLHTRWGFLFRFHIPLAFSGCNILFCCDLGVTRIKFISTGEGFWENSRRTTCNQDGLYSTLDHIVWTRGSTNMKRSGAVENGVKEGIKIKNCATFSSYVLGKG